MMIRADVKCYFCGHVSGQIEGDPAGSKSPWSYHPRSGAIISLESRRQRIRCGRCGGPVYIDEIESVRGLTSATRQSLVALAS
jgi:hypothetical protein